ncbi:hypothetical protein KC902_00710 [Candidatus Kaiserbacteria bacterium]|nr:hypothetical protein [Candidatus Kaiserbacteria bacterium]
MSQENGLVHVRLCPDLRTDGPARKPPLFLLCNQDGKPFYDEETGNCQEVMIKGNARLQAVSLNDSISSHYAWLLKAEKCRLTHVINGHGNWVLISSEAGRREFRTGLLAGSVFAVSASAWEEQRPLRPEFVASMMDDMAAA